MTNAVQNANEIRQLEDLNYIAWLKEECHYHDITMLPGNRWCGIQRLMFHWTMHIGKMGDRFGYEDRFCYETFELAQVGLKEWEDIGFQGEPNYWHRHILTGRRRPNGDVNQEYYVE